MKILGMKNATLGHRRRLVAIPVQRAKPKGGATRDLVVTTIITVNRVQIDVEDPETTIRTGVPTALPAETLTYSTKPPRKPTAEATGDQIATVLRRAFVVSR